MTITQGKSNQLVISVEELENHYSFQLKQVGVAHSNALDIAALMIQATHQLTEPEQSRRDDAISLLEQKKVAVSPSLRNRKYRKRRNRLSSPVVETSLQTSNRKGLYGLQPLYKVMN